MYYRYVVLCIIKKWKKKNVHTDYIETKQIQSIIIIDVFL